MRINKNFFSFEGFVAVTVSLLIILTSSAIIKSIADDVSVSKIDKEINRTYMQWAKNHGDKGKETVDEYLKCLKYNGDRREVGNRFPDKKDCLILNKDKDFVEQMVTNIRSIDVSDSYKKEAVGK